MRLLRSSNSSTRATCAGIDCPPDQAVAVDHRVPTRTPLSRPRLISALLRTGRAHRRSRCPDEMQRRLIDGIQQGTEIGILALEQLGAPLHCLSCSFSA